MILNDSNLSMNIEKIGLPGRRQLALRRQTWQQLLSFLSKYPQFSEDDLDIVAGFRDLVVFVSEKLHLVHREEIVGIVDHCVGNEMNGHVVIMKGDE